MKTCKKKLNCVLALLMFLPLLGCGKATTPASPFPLTYSNGDYQISVTEAAPLKPPILVESEWRDASQDNLRTREDLIVKAEVTEITEYRIEYTKEITRETYGSRIVLEILETFFDAGQGSVREGDTITAHYEISSHWMPEENAAVLEEGEEYYLALRDASRSESPLGYDRFVDYIVDLPKTTDYIPRTGDLLSAEFAQLLSNNNTTSPARTVLRECMNIEDALRLVFNEEG